MGIEWLFLARVVRTEMGFVSASRQPMSIIKLDEIAHTIYQPSSIILRSLSSESGRYHSDEPRCTRIGTRTICGEGPGPRVSICNSLLDTMLARDFSRSDDWRRGECAEANSKTFYAKWDCDNKGDR
jgi:hypothetical protein